MTSYNDALVKSLAAQREAAMNAAAQSDAAVVVLNEQLQAARKEIEELRAEVAAHKPAQLAPADTGAADA